VHADVALLHADAELLERPLALDLDLLRLAQLVLPRLVDRGHELLGALHLLLQLGLGDGLDLAGLGLCKASVCGAQLRHCATLTLYRTICFSGGAVGSHVDSPSSPPPPPTAARARSISSSSLSSRMSLALGSCAGA
jgi:hypothetical protein